MIRNALVETLRAYHGDKEEANFLPRMLALLEKEPRCFYRDCFVPGHITGSGLLMSKSGQKILMNHHKSLNIWVCFGGHADGDEDIQAVAAREVVEESGINAIKLAQSGIFDIDIHDIPPNAKKAEPAHQHFDITFLFQVALDEAFVQSDESHDLKWCDLGEAQTLSPLGRDLHMDRLFRKWQKWLRGNIKSVA